MLPSPVISVLLTQPMHNLLQQSLWHQFYTDLFLLFCLCVCLCLCESTVPNRVYTESIYGVWKYSVSSIPSVLLSLSLSCYICIHIKCSNDCEIVSTKRFNARSKFFGSLVLMFFEAILLFSLNHIEKHLFNHFFKLVHLLVFNLTRFYTYLPHFT